MMSCTGNKWLKTPAVDYLAANGTRFERAYTTNPYCVPARVGMMTGWFPGTFGVRANRSGHKFNDVGGRTGYAQTNIGAQLKRAGYDLAYGGKVHLPDAVGTRNLGVRGDQHGPERRFWQRTAQSTSNVPTANRITWLRHSSTRTISAITTGET